MMKKIIRNICLFICLVSMCGFGSEFSTGLGAVKAENCNNAVDEITVVKNGADTVKTTCKLSSGVVLSAGSSDTETTFYRGDQGTLAYKNNLQVNECDSAEWGFTRGDPSTKGGTRICDYEFTLPAVNYAEYCQNYGIVYFTVKGGASKPSYSLTAYGNEVLRTSAAGQENVIAIHNARLYVDGIYKTDIPTNVYNGVAFLKFTVTIQPDDVYAYFAMSDIYAGYEKYNQYDAELLDGMRGTSEGTGSITPTVSVVESGTAKYNVLYSLDFDFAQSLVDQHNISFAAEEFYEFMHVTTGALFDMVDTDSTKVSVGGYHIVLDKLAAEINGNDYSGLTTDTGYKIFREGNLIFIYGKTSFGTLNGIYAFMQKFTGLKFYTDTVYDYTPVADVSVSTLNITYNPDIEYNFASGGSLTGSYESNGSDYPWAYQHRLGFVAEHYVEGGASHNFLDVVSEAEYGSAHPDWFVTESVYSANGTNTGRTFTTLNLSCNNFEMAEVVADYLADSIKNDIYKRTFYQFSQPDHNGWSTAASSSAIKEEYGVNSAEYILFMNKVAEILDEDYVFDRPIRLMMLAYGAVAEAPAYTSELVLYDTVDVKVGVFYAPIEMNHYRKLQDSTAGLVTTGKTNEYYAQEFMKWSALTDEIYYWNYAASFDNYFIPLDSISSMQDNYRFAYELGVKAVKDQGQTGNLRSLDWEALKVYLRSELAKDVEADVDDLVEDFCDHYYGNASLTMQQLLSLQRAWYQTLAERTHNSNNGLEAVGLNHVDNYLFNKWAWDEGEKAWYQLSYSYDNSMLSSWYGYIITALGQVNDQEIKDRIMLEGLTIRYLSLRVYNTPVFAGDTIGQIETDAEMLGMMYYAEGKPIEFLSDTML